MAATELRVEKLSVPKSSREVSALLQQLLSLKGLVSFSVSREGIEIKRYRSLHDPPISDDSPIVEQELGIALATLDEIVELDDTPTIELALTKAAHLISEKGYVPTVLVLPKPLDLVKFEAITGLSEPALKVEGPTYVAGYRVEFSDLLAEGTFLLLGATVSDYNLNSVRIAVRIFTKETSNATDQEERDSLSGEATTTTEAGA